MRSREFIMKDAYSFNINQDRCSRLTTLCGGAYTRIFTRLGLISACGEADTGAIGGSVA
ncbi:MAG: hypothetical protein R3E89_16210 [Thiolinea sp.]